MLYRFTLLSLGWLSVTHSLNLYSHFQLNFQFLLTFCHYLIWAEAISVHCLGHWDSRQLKKCFPRNFTEGLLGSCLGCPI